MSVDTQVMLDMIRQQLSWLERELALLHQTLGQPSPKDMWLPTFESLRGVWAGVVFNQEDFQASRLTFPENL